MITGNDVNGIVVDDEESGEVPFMVNGYSKDEYPLVINIITDILKEYEEFKCCNCGSIDGCEEYNERITCVNCDE